MNRYSVFFCFAFSVLAAGCVIPGAPGQVLSLAAEPDPVFYPAGSSIFDRAQNLTVRAFTSEGREIVIPPGSYTMTFDGHPHVDHYSLYDIRAYKGTVEYMGKLSIFPFILMNRGNRPMPRLSGTRYSAVLPPSRVLRGCIRLALSALLLALFQQFPLAAQSRTDIKIFIPRPLANTGINKQQDFFAEQFKMEISAANYTVTDGQDEADYLIQLTIDDNEYWGEPDEKQFILTLALIRAEGSAEIVRFSWPFTEMIEMYQWNLYLVYQAMANVPMTKEVDEPVKTIVEREVRTESPAARDDRWRNKWLYVNFSAGADMVYLVRTGSVLTDQGLVAPIGFVGAEIQFLDMMALELDALKVRLLHDTNRYVITLNPSALLKWVFKPDDFAMIEPYAGAEYSFAVTGEKLPWLSVLVGVQAGVRGGEYGAVIIDFGVSYSLLGSWHLASGEREYGVMRFVFSAGYKLGFWNRKK